LLVTPCPTIEDLAELVRRLALEKLSPTQLLLTVLGVLIECDPAIKAIILKIDEEQHNYVMEDLDDQHLMIKENQLNSLKKRLEEV
jgi:TFIIH basal transcription factor complex TTD-A subunit